MAVDMTERLDCLRCGQYEVAPGLGNGLLDKWRALDHDSETP
jgi:hypothetical protein